MDVFKLAAELQDEPFHTWLRVEHKTARWAAKKLDVTPDYLSMVRNRRRRPSRDLVRAMVELAEGKLTERRLADWHELPPATDDYGVSG